MPLHNVVIDDGQRRNLLEWVRQQAQAGSLPNWIDALAVEEKRSLSRLLKQCFSHTLPRLHHSDKKFKKEFNCNHAAVWVIKDFQIRIYGVCRGLDFVAVHYFKKKTDKLSREEKRVICSKVEEYVAEVTYAH